MSELVLGVDFGSSSTIAGALVGDRIELVPDAGDVVIPSVIYVPDRGPPEDHARGRCHALGAPEDLGNPEVADFDLTVHGHQDVRWRDVSMDDTQRLPVFAQRFMRRVQACTRLSNDTCRDCVR